MRTPPSAAFIRLRSVRRLRSAYSARIASGAYSRGVPRGHVAGDQTDCDEQEGDAAQDENTVGLHAGEERPEQPGDPEGSEQAYGGAEQRELRSSTEHEADDVSDLGPQR